MTAVASRDAIASLAMLKVNYDSAGRDYIDNFVPFAVEALGACKGPVVTVGEVQQVLKAAFGIFIPQAALRTVLARAAKQRWAVAREGGFQIDDSRRHATGFAERRDAALRDEQSLIESLVAFSASDGPPWTSEQAENALLRLVGERGSVFLSAALDPKRSEPVGPTDAGENALLGRFVYHLHEEDPSGWDAFATIVKGAVLARAAYLPDIGSATRRFDGLHVYLDTRFLLRALGTAGPLLEAPPKELLDLAYELGASLRVFDSTVAEMKRVLRSAAMSLRDPRVLRRTTGESLEYMASAGYQASDVELLIARLEDRLSALRVSVARKPDPVPALTVDEPELARRLQREVRYPREEVAAHDIAVVTAVYRLRGGEDMFSVESARAVFITTNTPLARGVADFFALEEGQAGVPLCIPDEEFATVAWLKRPVAAPDLPARYVIADAYAAMNPSGALWKEYLKEIDRLEENGDISDEDYHVLRYTLAARAALLGLSGGRAASVRPAVPEILAKAKKALVAEVQSEEARKSSQGILMPADSARVEELEATLSALRRSRLAAFQRLSVAAGKWASRAFLGLAAADVLALAYFGLAAAFPGFPTLPTWIISPLWPITLLGLIAYLILGILSLWNGMTLLSLARIIDARVARSVDNRLRLLFGE